METNKVRSTMNAMFFSIAYMLVYCGFGAVTHWIFKGDTFDSNSVSSWALLLGWPMIMMLCFFIAGILIIIAALVIFGIIDWWSDRGIAKRAKNYTVQTLYNYDGPMSGFYKNRSGKKGETNDK